MKALSNILIASAAIISGLAAASCSIDLTSETKSSFEEPVVFANYTIAEYNVLSIYEVLMHQNCHRARYLAWYGFNTDTELYVSTTKDNKSEIARYGITVTNDQLNLANGPFNELQGGVERANLCIRGLKNYGNIDSDAAMGQLYGEALVARAFLYAELLKAYGEVPARFEPISPETIYVGKTDRDVIFKQILADLEESWKYMTYTQNANVTRPGLAFSKALYARLVLVACGKAQRPADGKVNTGDPGEVRYSTYFTGKVKDELYAKALAALEDVITKGGYSLYANYEQLWRDFNNFVVDNGKEVIYALPMSDARGRWNYTVAVRCEKAADGGVNPWTTGTDNRGGSIGPMPTLYWKYPAGDQRRDVSCANFKFVGKQAVPAGGGNWYFGKYRFDWMEKVPYTNGNDDGCKPIYMRYADVLLMASEIANELGDLDKAKQYMKPVVSRAFRADEAKTEAYMSGISGKDAMLDAIIDQRGLEFVGEFLRKGDLIRWGCLKEKLDQAITEMSQFADPEKYAGTPFAKIRESIGKTVWYKYNADGYSISTWGYNPGETTAPDASWIEYTDSAGKTTESYFKLSDEKLTSVYDNDPNTYQWWPIPQATLTNSQGAIVNDYCFF